MAQQATHTWRDNLSDLQDGSLELILLFMGVIGLVYLVWTLYPSTGGPDPIGGLLSSGLLVVVGVSGFYIKRRSLSLASVVVIISVQLAIAIALSSSRISSVAYLFVVPIILAGVLLGTRATFVSAIPTIVIV